MAGFIAPLIFQKRRFTIDEFRAMPRYEFAEEPGAAVAGRAAVGLAGILAPTLALAALGTRALSATPSPGTEPNRTRNPRKRIRRCSKPST
jgi:hypothetical protein